MKLNLTHDEAVKQLTILAATRYEVPCATIEVVIGEHAPAPSADLVWDAVQVVRSFRDHKGANKIPAIKAVREFSASRGSALGLAAAKFFVESIA